MYLSYFGCDDKPRNLEELIGCDVLVADYLLRVSGIAKPTIGVWLLRGDPPEFRDERIVLACEQVVQEGQADSPVIGKRRGFLPDGRAMEFSQSFYRGDTYDFIAELNASDTET